MGGRRRTQPRLLIVRLEREEGGRGNYIKKHNGDFFLLSLLSLSLSLKGESRGGGGGRRVGNAERMPELGRDGGRSCALKGG